MLLPLSLRTLQRYETSENGCPMDVIPIIANEYKDRTLLYDIIRQIEPWQDAIGKVEFVELTQAACAMLNAVNDMEACKAGMLEIVSDGVVKPSERERWEKVVSATKKMMVAGLQLLEATERRETD
nr:MAG TPA: regulatory protein [Caudoviricetes sp.]